MLKEHMRGINLKRGNIGDYEKKEYVTEKVRGTVAFMKNCISVTPENGSALIIEKGSTRKMGRERVGIYTSNYKPEKEWTGSKI